MGVWILLLRAAAVDADADDAQQVLRDFEPVLGGHGILNRFELGGVKLDDLSALRADHVVVMLVFVVVFVVSASIAEPDFAREPRFGKEFQGPVDCRLPDAGVFFLHEPVQVFVGEVLLGA